MSLLKDFEHKLESLLEGFFAKSFRSGVHPLEIAKKLARNMEESKFASISRVYVPNSYTIYLSQQDKERLAAFEVSLKTEVQEFLKSQAEKEELTLLGQPEIKILPRKELELGEIRIESKLITPKDLPKEERGETSAGEVVSLPRATLVLLNKERRTFPLSKETITIGRLESNDIVLEDPQVSRVHAEIRRQQDHFVVADLGSTNGTFLGKKRVKKDTLKHRDILTLGKTEFEFRRE